MPISGHIVLPTDPTGPFNRSTQCLERSTRWGLFLREAHMQAAAAALDYLTALVLIGLAVACLGWVKRHCANLRGHRLPPMRLL